MAPRFRNSETVIRHGKTEEFTVTGDYPDIQHIQLLQILVGRFINTLDIKDKRKVAVIGTHVQTTLFKKEENPIGKYIRIRGIFFQVVGIFKIF